MKKVIAILLFTISLSGCTLFNLDFQYNYKNDKTPIVLTMDITCYEYIKSRKNIDMSLMFEAIERSEMKSFYEEKGHTYFLLNDTEYANWLSSQKYASVKSVPKSALQSMLKGYSLPQEYLSNDLTTTPIDVLSCDGVKKVRMWLYPSAATASQNRYTMQVGYVKENGTAGLRNMTTTNLRPTNGVAHLLTQHLW